MSVLFWVITQNLKLLCTAHAFVVPFLTLYSSELPFKLMDGHINAAVSIFTCFATNENLAVFGPGNYLHAGIAALAAVYNHFNLIDTIVVLGKLGSLLLCVSSDSFRYVDMFTADCKKQNRSP
jgi:hypothetical protein